MNVQTITVQQLQNAIRIKQQIESLENELAKIIGGSGSVASKPSAAGGMSAEGRARIIEAQKARWAKFHKDRGVTPAKAKSAGARTMSAEAKAKIAAAARKRWAAAKKAGKNKL